MPSVHLEITHPTATAIGIAGTFNEWRPQVTPMIPLGGGRWIKELVLPPGVYEYRLVIDGEWMSDLRATETTPNAFGGLNSVLKVKAVTCPEEDIARVGAASLEVGTASMAPGRVLTEAGAKLDHAAGNDAHQQQ